MGLEPGLQAQIMGTPAPKPAEPPPTPLGPNALKGTAGRPFFGPKTNFLNYVPPLGAVGSPRTSPVDKNGNPTMPGAPAPQHPALPDMSLIGLNVGSGKQVLGT